MLAATQWNGTWRSAKSRPGSAFVQHVPERLDGVQVGAGPHQPDGPAPERLAERVAQRLALPQLGQPVRRTGRVSRHERAVDRADRGAHDQIGPHARLLERAEHADLVRAEQAAAAEHERGLAVFTG